MRISKTGKLTATDAVRNSCKEIGSNGHDVQTICVSGNLRNSNRNVPDKAAASIDEGSSSNRISASAGHKYAPAEIKNPGMRQEKVEGDAAFGRSKRLGVQKKYT